MCGLFRRHWPILWYSSDVGRLGPYQNRLCAEEQTPLLVPTITLDAFEATPPDLIKIDVEGAEGKMLRGARRF